MIKSFFPFAVLLLSIVIMCCSCRVKSPEEQSAADRKMELHRDMIEANPEFTPMLTELVMMPCVERVEFTAAERYDVTVRLGEKYSFDDIKEIFECVRRGVAFRDAPRDEAVWYMEIPANDIEVLDTDLRIISSGGDVLYELAGTFSDPRWPPVFSLSEPYFPVFLWNAVVLPEDETAQYFTFIDMLSELKAMPRVADVEFTEADRYYATVTLREGDYNRAEIKEIFECVQWRIVCGTGDRRGDKYDSVMDDTADEPDGLPDTVLTILSADGGILYEMTGTYTDLVPIEHEIHSDGHYYWHAQVWPKEETEFDFIYAGRCLELDWDWDYNKDEPVPVIDKGETFSDKDISFIKENLGFYETSTISEVHRVVGQPIGIKTWYSWFYVTGEVLFSNIIHEAYDFGCISYFDTRIQCFIINKPGFEGLRGIKIGDSYERVTENFLAGDIYSMEINTETHSGYIEFDNSEYIPETFTFLIKGIITEFVYWSSVWD